MRLGCVDHKPAGDALHGLRDLHRGPVEVTTYQAGQYVSAIMKFPRLVGLAIT
jgi:hypothetical protein